MDALGLDYQVVFPTPMLTLGMHPQDEIEVAIGAAYNKWLVERILPEDDRLKGMIYLPFNTPEACVEEVKKYANVDSVIGYSVVSTRNKPVHHNSYMKLYAMMEETGKPFSFHSGFNWNDPSFLQLNRFISMHALSFVHYSLIHMTNWIINGLPERFPKMKVLWIESGLAWIPYLMQRLDHEYQMRTCEAPLLKRLPSDYMRDMFYTSQPMEKTNLKLLEATMEAFNAETQLLYASDWPHWDFDAPSSITTLPFLSDQAKRNILGLNAARLFNLEVKRRRPKAQGRAGGAAGRVLTMAVPAQAEATALGDDFVAAAERALSAGQPGQVSDADLERVMTAAVRLYAAKAETDTAAGPADHAVGGDADRDRRDGERSHSRRRAQSLGRVDVVQPEERLGECNA